MKKRVSTILSLILILAMLLNMAATTLFALPESSDIATASDTEIDYTQYVNIFNGTGGDHGQLSPAAQVPHGLVKPGPDTWPKTSGTAQSGYDFNSLLIRGFSHTRIDGTGNVGAGGDVRIMPSLSAPTAGFNPDTGSMYKANEEASVGYYKTDLTATAPVYTATTPDGKLAETVTTDAATTITAEMTARTRTGYHKYTFPSDTAYFYIDLGDAFAGRPEGGAYIAIVGENKLEGYVIGGNVTGRTTNFYKMYFAVEFEAAFSSVSLYNNSEALTENTSELGANVGAVVSFSGVSTPIYAKVTMSTISTEQAWRDMAAEAPDYDFEDARADAEAAWNDILSRVAIEDSRTDEHTTDLIEMTYTALYRSLTLPMNATSTDGTYMGSDGNVYDAGGTVHYDGWSLWDDYRKYPLIGIIAPEIYHDIIRSITSYHVHKYENGRGDYWAVPNVGYENAITLLADGIAKGYWDDDMELVYKAMKSGSGRFSGTDRALGYKSTTSEIVSDTLEYSYSDYCQALVAIALAGDMLDKGDTEEHAYYVSEAEYYLKGAMLYRNLWLDGATTNSETGEDIGLFVPKDSSGAIVSYDPLAFAGYCYEGCLWQWRWATPHDVKGAASLSGGTAKMLADLTYFFDNNWFSAVNETDLQAPYMFNILGAPALTQKWVHNVYTEAITQVFHNHGKYAEPITDQIYKNQIEAYPQSMDDDTGTMSAMYLAATLGLFPFVAGDGTLQIGSPAYEKVTLNIGGGKTFTITASGVSRDNYYIQSATLNGKTFNRTWLDYSEIARGGEIVLNMGAEPSDWAADGIQPASASDITSDVIRDGALLDPLYRDPASPTPDANSSEGGFTVPPADDSMVHWSFEETVDAESGTYPLTASMTPVFADGRFEKALSLDGKTYLYTEDASLAFGEGNFAVSLFVKPASTANATIIGKEDTGANTGWSIRIDSGYYQFNIIDNSTYRVVGTIAPTVGGWDHLVAVRDGGSVYLYVNGQLAGSKNNIGTRSLDSTSPFRIGARSNNGAIGLMFTGLVDEVKVFNKAIDAGRVAKLYSEAPSADEAPAEMPDDAHFTFDKTLSDDSGYYSFIGEGVYSDGRFKSALTLDGTVSYALAADALDFGTADFSVSAWFKLSALPLSGSVIVGKEDSGKNTGWSIRYNNGYFELNIKDDANYRIVTDVAPVLGEWYHAVAVRSGGSAHLYVNGELKGSRDNLGEMDLTSTAAFRIGARTNNGTIDRYNKSTVDELTVYNTAIGADKVAELYSMSPVKADRDPAPTDYIAYWMFNGNLKDVTTKYDLITDGNHGFTAGQDGFGCALDATSKSSADVYSDSEAFNFGRSDFTVSLWFNYNADAATIISKEEYGTGKSGWSLRINNGELQFNLPGSTSCRISTTAPEKNAWHHAIIGRNGGTTYMYLNGELVGTNSSIGTYSVNSPNPLRIGARTTDGAPTQYLVGSVDELRIYARAISAAEAQSLYLETPMTVIHPSGTGFTEDISASAAAGSVKDKIQFIIGSGEKWLDADYGFTVVPEGTEISWSAGDGAIKLYGVPEGLTPVFTRIDDYTLEMSFIGTADHDDGDYEYTVHVEFNPAYIILDGTPISSAAKISGSSVDLPVQFYAARLSWSGDVLTESVLGSGVLGSVIEIDIKDEDGTTPSDILTFSGTALEVGKDVIITGLPAGITAVATVDASDPTKLYISFEGAAEIKRDLSDISIKLSASAFSDPTKVVYNVEKSGILADLANLQLWYSASALYESERGDGSISGEIYVDLTDVEFADAAELPISAQGLPEGLSLTAERISATKAVVRISGRALANGIDDSTAFTLIFAPEAFANADTAYVAGIEKDILLCFDDATVTLSKGEFTESAKNNGSIYAPIIISIADSTERFAGKVGEDFIESGKLTVNGIPEGLTAEATLTSGGKIRLQLSGAATNHTANDSVEYLTLVFSDEAFSGGDATAVSSSILNALSGPAIRFVDEVGEEPEHTYAPATCLEPRICTDCFRATGEPLGHMYLEDKCTVCGMNRDGFIPGTVLKTEKSFSAVKDNTVAFHKTSGSEGGVSYTKFYFDAPEGNTNTANGYIQLSFGATDVVVRNGGNHVKNTDYFVFDFDISTDSEMFNTLQFHVRFKTSAAKNAQNSSSYPVLVGNNVRGLYVSDGTSNGGNEITAPNTDYNKAWRHVSFVYDFSGNNPLGYVNHVYVDGEYAGSMEACISTAVYLEMFRVSTNDAFSSLTNGTNVKFANLTATRFGVGYDGMIDDPGVLANPAVSLYDIPELAYCVEGMPEGTIDENVGKLAEITSGGKAESVYDILDLDASLKDGDSVKLFANIKGSIIVPKGADIKWDTNGYNMPTLLEYDYSEVYWVTRNLSGTVIASGGASSKDGRIITDELYASINRVAGRCTITLLNDYVLYGKGDAGSSVTSGKLAYYDMMTVFDLNGHTMSVELLASTNTFSPDTSYYHNIRVKICDGNMVFKPGASSSFFMMGQSATIRLDNVDIDVNTSTFADVRRGEMWLRDSNVTLKGGEMANMRSYHGIRSLLVVDASTITAEKGSYAVDMNPLATGGGHTGMLDYIVVRNGSVLRSPEGYAFIISTLLPKTCTSAYCKPNNHVFITITDSLVEAKDGVLNTTPSVKHEGTVLNTRLDIHNSEIKAAQITVMSTGALASMSECTYSTDVTVGGSSKLDIDGICTIPESGAHHRTYLTDGVLSMLDVISGEETPIFLENEKSDVAYTSLGGEYGYVITSEYRDCTYAITDHKGITVYENGEFLWNGKSDEEDMIDMSRILLLPEDTTEYAYTDWTASGVNYTSRLVPKFNIFANLTALTDFYLNVYLPSTVDTSKLTVVIDNESVGKFETVTVGGKVYYKAEDGVIKGITPENVGKEYTVEITLVGGRGENVRLSTSVSIEKYLTSALETTTGEGKKFIQSIINYVVAATAFDGKVNETLAPLATSPDAPIYTDAKWAGPKEVSASLNLGDSVRWVFSTESDDKYQISYAGGTRLFTAKDGEIIIGVRAVDLLSDITITNVTTGVSGAINIAGYRTVLAGNEAAQRVIDALYYYSVSASEYASIHE